MVEPPLSLGTIPGAWPVAEISGLRPSTDAADATKQAALRDALWTHGVVCVRFAAPLDDDEARAVATMIGAVKDPVGRTRDGGSLRYGEDRQIIDAGFVMTDEIRAALGDETFGGDDVRPGSSSSSTPTTRTPSVRRPRPCCTRASSRRAAGRHVLPRHARRVRAARARRTRRESSDLRAAHAYNNEGAFPPRSRGDGSAGAARGRRASRRSRAPGRRDARALLRPRSRDARRRRGRPTLGAPLLQSLQDHAEQHAPRYAHEWRAHDVLVWDNASVQHKASSDFPVGEPRRFWRYMVDGPAPVAFSPVDERSRPVRPSFTRWSRGCSPGPVPCGHARCAQRHRLRSPSTARRMLQLPRRRRLSDR